MKTADQLATTSIQAYDNFKAVTQNVASVNGVVAALFQAASQNAALGLFEASVNLNGIDDASGNAVLFQRFLNEILTVQGFVVSFSGTFTTTNVIINWDPEVTGN